MKVGVEGIHTVGQLRIRNSDRGAKGKTQLGNVQMTLRDILSEHLDFRKKEK